MLPDFPTIKTRYLLIGAALLFTTLTYFSFYFWWQDNQQSVNINVEQASAQGKQFAQYKTQQACLDQMIKSGENCRELACSMELKHFFAACFKHAAPSPELCEKIPDADDYFAKVSWAVSTCRKRKVKSGNCPNLIDSVPELCLTMKAKNE